MELLDISGDVGILEWAGARRQHLTATGKWFTCCSKASMAVRGPQPAYQWQRLKKHGVPRREADEYPTKMLLNFVTLALSCLLK